MSVSSVDPDIGSSVLQVILPAARQIISRRRKVRGIFFIPLFYHIMEQGGKVALDTGIELSKTAGPGSLPSPLLCVIVEDNGPIRIIKHGNSNLGSGMS
jgi:hypothetical protein